MTPKDFDKERQENHAEREAALGDRSLVLGGETFTYRPFVSYTVLLAIANTDEAEGAVLIEALERGIIDMLEDGQEERFLAIAHSKTDPWTFADLNSLCTWLTEAQVKRPTLAPSLSTAGGATTPTSSTDASSSKPAEASAA